MYEVYVSIYRTKHRVNHEGQRDISHLCPFLRMHTRQTSGADRQHAQTSTDDNEIAYEIAQCFKTCTYAVKYCFTKPTVVLYLQKSVVYENMF